MHFSIISQHISLAAPSLEGPPLPPGLKRRHGPQLFERGSPRLESGTKSAKSLQEIQDACRILMNEIVVLIPSMRLPWRIVSLKREAWAHGLVR